MNLHDIYSEIILENSRSQKNRRTLSSATKVLHGVNPSCGDDITLALDIRDGVLVDAAFQGEGCAISQASTSLMIDLIKGKTVEEASRYTELFLGMILSGEDNADTLAPLEDAVALQSVSKMPARVKCAVLPWRTLEPEVAPKTE